MNNWALGLANVIILEARMPHEKTIGKPGAGNPHVRFERGPQETEPVRHRALNRTLQGWTSTSPRRRSLTHRYQSRVSSPCKARTLLRSNKLVLRREPSHPIHRLQVAEVDDPAGGPERRHDHGHAFNARQSPQLIEREREVRVARAADHAQADAEGHQQEQEGKASRHT